MQGAIPAAGRSCALHAGHAGHLGQQGRDAVLAGSAAGPGADSRGKGLCQRQSPGYAGCSCQRPFQASEVLKVHLNAVSLENLAIKECLSCDCLMMYVVHHLYKEAGASFLRARCCRNMFAMWSGYLPFPLLNIIVRIRRWHADGRRRAAAFGRSLTAHLMKMKAEPGAYGQLGLSELLEMREDCLREFRFSDVYRCTSSSPLKSVPRHQYQ